MAEMKVIAGLGNPGREYEDTRHNAGFKVVETIARQLGIEVNRMRFGGCLGRCEFEGKKLILLEPLKYMNRSGEVVAELMGFYKLSLDDLLVVTDDMALEPGRIRVRAKGSAGGHNGLADIIEKLGSVEFCRLRIGIGASGRLSGRDYVLGRLGEHEKDLLNAGIETAAEAALCWLREGVVKTMNKFNPL